MNKSLQDCKKDMLKGLKEPSMLGYIESMCIEKKRPLGKFNPWAWWVELVRGCNLSCWHCPVRLFPKNEFHFMEEETWLSLLKIIQECTPYGRLEFGNAGEPTLHPRLLDYLSVAREVCPNLQMMTYTNGTQIIKGKMSYKELFDAGLNMIFVDMYSPFEDHKKIAEESGYLWYHQDNKPKDAPSIFTNHRNPNIHIIMLSENPSNWSSRKTGRGAFSTFLNTLDWSMANKYDIFPVDIPPKRGCDIPTKFPSVNFDGTYPFCCNDFVRNTAGRFGDVFSGTEGFLNFWIGNYMQVTRKLLYEGDRHLHEFCKMCNQTTPRCDIRHWKEKELFNNYWTGKEWKEI